MSDPSQPKNRSKDLIVWTVILVAVGLVAAIWWSSSRAKPIVPINIPRNSPEHFKVDQYFLQNGVSSVAQETYGGDDIVQGPGISAAGVTGVRTVTYGP